MICFESGSKMTNEKFKLQEKYIEYIKKDNDTAFAQTVREEKLIS